MTKATEYTAVFDRIRWQSPERDFVIGYTKDQQCVLGPAKEGELLGGVAYCFHGKWDDHPQHGKQFKFTHFIQKQPHTRHGVVAYMAKHAPGIGPRIAADLYDAFGTDAIVVLRSAPERAAGRCKWLTVAQAKLAAAELEKLVALEETRIGLTDLLAGRGFQGQVHNLAIQQWGIHAPEVIRRDPFVLLVNDYPSAGFNRCDRLYLDLGLPPDRLKRLTICLWHIMREDMNGHTWHRMSGVIERLGQLVSGVEITVAKAKKAIAVGERSGWLAVRDGKWIAEGKKAANEATLAMQLTELCRYSMVPEVRKGKEAVAC